MSDTGNIPPNNAPSAPASSTGDPTHVNLITMIQNMLQTVLANCPPALPVPPAPIMPNNMVKFSDLNRFTGRPQDIDSFVRTIEFQILSAQGTGLFTADFQMTAYFMSWLGPGVPEKGTRVSGRLNQISCIISNNS